jgi:hypothetical protein
MPTVKTLGDVVIYLGALAGALAAIGLLMRYTLLRPFRAFLSREISGPLGEIRDQLATYGDLSKRLDDHLVNHAGELGRQHG